MGARGFSVQSGLSSSRSVPVSTGAVCAWAWGGRGSRQQVPPSTEHPVAPDSEWEGLRLVQPPPHLGSLPPAPPPPPWAEDSQHSPWLAGRWSLGAEWLDLAPGLWGAGARGSTEFPGALSRTCSEGSIPHALTPVLGHLCFLGPILGGCCLGARWTEPLGQSCVKSGPWWRSHPRHPGHEVVMGACWAREGRQDSHVACSHGWGCPRGPR